MIQHKERIASGDMIVYFVDECHVLGDTAVGYGWAPSDQRVTVLVNNNHDRQTYFGALQMLTGAFVLAEYPTANGDTTVAFMHRLRNKHPGKQLLILWDNASYHYQGDMRGCLKIRMVCDGDRASATFAASKRGRPSLHWCLFDVRNPYSGADSD